jgi:dipeptidyl aminopeptidase/acylaminoacyl peptidase
MRQFRGRKTWLGRLAFSPDGRYLAAGRDPGTACKEVIQVWDMTGGDEPVAAVETGFSDDPFVFSPDGRYLHFGWGTEAARIDLRTGAEEPDPSLAVQETKAFSADGRYAYGIVPDPKRWSRKVPKLHLRLARWSPDGWAEAWKKTIPRDDPSGRTHFRLSPDGSRALRLYQVGSDSGWAVAVEVRASDSGKVTTRWTGGVPLSYYTQAAVAPDAARVAVLDAQYLHVIDPFRPGSDPLTVKNSTRKSITGAAFSPDGRWVATTSNDTAATLWDATSWTAVRSYEWKIGRLRSVAFAPDGLRCAAGSDTGQVVVWDVDG